MYKKSVTVPTDTPDFYRTLTRLNIGTFYVTLKPDPQNT